MAEVNPANAKLVQYLNEAYGLEARLQTALEAHIAMTTEAAYKRRLKQHLSETKRHGQELKKRVKQLGGVAATVDAPGPVTGAAQAVLSGAQKAAALAQGPLHALRGTGEEEKQLKNAKTEYVDESEEIATYSALAELAGAVGDKDTQRLARSIQRDEERMRSYLEKQIPRLTKALVRAEVPASQRGARARAKRVKAAPARKKPATARNRPAPARTKVPRRTKSSSARANAATAVKRRGAGRG